MIGVRHRQAFMILLGIVCSYMQKLSLAMALVAMSEPSEYYPVIKYSTAQKGILSSLYYYGYIVSSIPMSVIANQGGSSKIVALTIGVFGGLICMLTPLAAVWLNFETVCFLRFVIGVLYGTLYPSFMEFLSNWVIPQEREKFAWIWMGPSVAAVLMNPLGGLLAVSPGGWPSIFYCPGILSLIWGVCSLVFLAQSPVQHKTISEEEKRHIAMNMVSKPSKKHLWTSIPWLLFITSGPVWIIIITIGAARWFDGILQNFFPTFLHSVFGLAVEANGFLSVLPSLAQVIFLPIYSFLGGKLRNHVSVNASRKFWNSVSFFGMAIALLMLYFIPVDSFGAIALVVLAQSFYGAVFLGVSISILDVAPNYCGILHGYTSTLTGIAAAFSTTLVGYIITDEHDLSQWQLLFLLSAVVFILGNMCFVFFGSTEIQPWNDMNKSIEADASEVVTSAANESPVTCNRTI